MKAFIFQKLEGRVASDEDLKLSDTLRYYMRDSTAAKDLLYRRLRSLVDYENANKALEKARTKNKEVAAVCFSLSQKFLVCLSITKIFLMKAFMIVLSEKETHVFIPI